MPGFSESFWLMSLGEVFEMPMARAIGAGIFCVRVSLAGRARRPFIRSVRLAWHEKPVPKEVGEPLPVPFDLAAIRIHLFSVDKTTEEHS